MARTTGKLTAVEVPRLAKKPGFHADGNGLYLQVTVGGASWVLRYSIAGRARYMGLGPLRLFGLADARVKAAEAQRLIHGGKDPIDLRREERAKARIEAAKAITFKKAAASYIASHRAGWKNAKKLAGLWQATLETYADPVIGELPVQAIDTGLVLNVLEPIWTKKPETAGRVRQRIEVILDWAKVRGYRDGDNPARWKGHLDVLLPARSKVKAVQHHAALPFADVADFMTALRQQEGIAARAFKFAILTAARTNEALGARWSEIDITERTWTVPPERMKAKKEHRVPLSAPAVTILEEMMKLRPLGDNDGYVFPGQRRGKPLSNMAFLMLLRRMKRDDLTAHGFRSTFRDWAAERTAFPPEVAEMALAHSIADKVEAAYRRGDLFEKRRQLMAAWAEWCARPASAGANVAMLGGSASAARR